MQNANANLSSSPEFKTAWRVLRNTSQEDALESVANDILFTGSRGPGKTDTQLMRFRGMCGRGYGAFWRGVIFDREYKNLDDLVNKSKRWFNAGNDGCKFLESLSAYKWVWPTGEELLFRCVKRESDYWSYHGQEFPFIGWNELCKFPTSELFDMMLSCNRSSYTEKDFPASPPIDGNTQLPYTYQDIPLETFSTTNSYGPGHTWVKRRWIDPVPYGIMQRNSVNVFDPKTQERRDVIRTRQAFFGSYKENPYLDAMYIATLESDTNASRKKSWLGGSWDVVAGGAISDLWENSKHVVPRFRIPKTWRVDRALDWGSTHPLYVGWFAECNGEEATLLDGVTTFCPSRGTIILIDEMYLTEGIGTNRGLRWSATAVADAVVEREKLLIENEWISDQPWRGPADNQIWDVRESDVDSIGKKMEARGVFWNRSDKSPGSRKARLQLIRDRLEAINLQSSNPGLLFLDNCRAAIATIPTLPLDDQRIDDVDTTAEDHPYDAVGYRVLASSNRFVTNINASWAKAG